MPHCGQLFVPTAYQAYYCSTRCRWRFEQRKFRKQLGRRETNLGRRLPASIFLPFSHFRVRRPGGLDRLNGDLVRSAGLGNRLSLMESET